MDTTGNDIPNTSETGQDPAGAGCSEESELVEPKNKENQVQICSITKNSCSETEFYKPKINEEIQVQNIVSETEDYESILPDKIEEPTDDECDDEEEDSGERSVMRDSENDDVSLNETNDEVPTGSEGCNQTVSGATEGEENDEGCGTTSFTMEGFFGAQLEKHPAWIRNFLFHSYGFPTNTESQLQTGEFGTSTDRQESYTGCGTSLEGFDGTKKERKTPLVQNIQCVICLKTFTHKSNLKRHLRLHTKEKPHKCPECGKSFTRKHHLEYHLLSHNGEKLHQCEICGMKYKEKHRLKYHYLSHAGEKPHGCKVCGKSFKLKKYLAIHLRTHTGERPYHCCVCEETFVYSSRLSSHIKSHTGRENFDCSICGKRSETSIPVPVSTVIPIKSICEDVPVETIISDPIVPCIQ